MIKLVAVDLDGTLFNNRNEITRESAEAIRAVQERGVEFLICTGRDYVQMNDMMEAAGIACRSICMSGAALYDEQGVRLLSVCMTPKQVRMVWQIFRQEGLFCDIRTDAGNFAVGTAEETKRYYREVFYKSLELIGKQFSEAEIAKRIELIRVLPTWEAFEACHMDTYKLSGYTFDADILKRVRERLEAIDGLAVASSFPVNLEVTAAAAQKGQAIKRYARERNISDEEIMVIGDSENDLSMFESEYGYRVAMANADALIRARANYMTASNEEDGVAAALQRFVLGDQR